MTPQEWCWEYDLRSEQAKQIDKLMETGGKFSGPDWDKARAEHRKKMAKKNGTPD